MKSKLELTKELTNLFQKALGEAGLEDAVVMWSAQIKGTDQTITGSYVTGKRDTVPRKAWNALYQFFHTYFGIQNQ